MTKERLKYLLDRYLDNTATEAELEEYNAWYHQQEKKGLNLFEEKDEAATQVYADQLFNRIANNIQYEQEQVEKRKIVTLRRWLAVAAVVATVGSVLWFFSLNSHTKPAREVAATEQPAQWIQIANTTREKKSLVLPDGSTAEIWSNSELKYPSSFGQSGRQVWLTGKGYFKVVKDSSKPFTVYSGEVSTTALGTSFTITAWAGQQQVNVQLHTGKVVVRPVHANKQRAFTPVYLTPGQELLCDASKGMASLQQPAKSATGLPVAKKVMAPGSRTGYAASFDQQPLPAVLDAIAAGYKVSIQYNKQLLNDRVFSGSIRATDSLAQVLSRMAALHNLTIKPTNKGYIVASNL